MNEHKYACPFCGQHIEYTDAYSGMRMPCPKCRQPIVFPGLAARKMTSSLRLAGAVARRPANRFNFAAVIAFLRGFKHWKTVGVCLVPFALVAGALVAASMSSRHEAAPAPAPAAVVVDPHALDKLTDLTRADQLAQERLAAVNRAFAACQTAEQNKAALHNQRHGAAGPAAFQAADQAVTRAHQALAKARKDFDTAFAQYQQLGGAIDYRGQLP
jgi:hypothetical protein